jgi:maleylacetoacetate isomerase
MTSLKLYSYWRSGASYRVRIALALKGLAFETVPIHLVKDGGQQFSPEYSAINPQQLVPALEHDGQVITQSLAIIEYLDEVFPQTPLLPKESLAKARVKAFAQAIACDIHPLNNARVLKYITKTLNHSELERDQWIAQWISNGFKALEDKLNPQTQFAFGDTPGFAECFLVPQVYGARRFKVPLAAFPRIEKIDALCSALPAFIEASPERQPDYAP